MEYKCGMVESGREQVEAAHMSHYDGTPNEWSRNPEDKGFNNR